MQPNDYGYDIETYPDIFTFYAIHCFTGQVWYYEISTRRNDVLALVDFVKALGASGGRMVGFNNVGFDYPVIHWIIENYLRGITVADIYAEAQRIIATPWEDRFKNHVRPHRCYAPQVDLFLINHFDNVARSTSLKVLEFNMRSDTVEDLPFNPLHPVGMLNYDHVASYNGHDVEETVKFYHHCQKAIAFRAELSEKYGQDFTNFNDTKIGKRYFIDALEQANPGSCYDNNRPRQTHRDYIDLQTVIFPYTRFERPEFNAVLDWLRAQRITQTKGVFTDIHEADLGELRHFCKMRMKRQKKHTGPGNAFEWVDEKDFRCWNVADNLNCVIDGFQFDFGTGGIHGSIEAETVRECERFALIDLDVASYYPNLAIANRIYPYHLGETFCDVYADVYQQRKAHKKAGNDNEQAALKLALNGVYGASNDKYGPFYDPAFTMAITVNGQLSLCMLAEQLLKIPQLRMVQINTDGLTVLCPRHHVQSLENIRQWWEQLTGLELEAADYSRMMIRDVNNYIAEYTDGKLKRKGKYEYNVQWHQNASALVVPKAAEAALVRGESVRDFILNHDDAFDFMLRTKVPRNSRLEIGGQPAQNVTRYYIATHGSAAVKIMPPTKPGNAERRQSVNAGYLVRECNNVKNFDPRYINYDWYITEALKLVEPCL